MPVTVNNKADFKGMLLQVRNRPGQRYVFLLFRTDTGLRMCLSKNIELVASMKIGQKYRVQGQEYTTADKTYLNMVSAKPILSTAKMFRKRAGLMAGAASLLLVVGVGGTSALVHRNAQRNNQASSPDKVNIQNKQDEKTPSTTSKLSDIISQSSSVSPSQASPTTVPTPKPTTNTVKPVTTSPTPMPTPPSSQSGSTSAADTTSPTAPSALTGDADTTGVNLAWAASTDEVGVTGYRIYREGVLLASVGNIQSYSDATAAASTGYTYTVRAEDAAGNVSGSSNSVLVNTPASSNANLNNTEQKEPGQ